MRKIKLKKQDKLRNKKYKLFRSSGFGKIEFTDKNGKIIWLNLSKRFIFNKNYKNEEYQKELKREAEKLQGELDEFSTRRDQTNKN